MRYINEIIIHCTDTEAGKEYSAAEIAKWHKARGWQTIGYHFVVHLDGTIETGRKVEQVGAHCQGHNTNSIGIVYVGGKLDGKAADTRTDKQKRAIAELVAKLCAEHPAATVHGHKEFNSGKACPCYDVAAEYAELNAERELLDPRRAMQHAREEHRRQQEERRNRQKRRSGDE